MQLLDDCNVHTINKQDVFMSKVWDTHCLADSHEAMPKFHIPGIDSYTSSYPAHLIHRRSLRNANMSDPLLAPWTAIDMKWFMNPGMISYNVHNWFTHALPIHIINTHGQCTPRAVPAGIYDPGYEPIT